MHPDDSRKPLIGITMGDPAGIGPEIIVKALEKQSIWKLCVPLVLGDPEVMARALRVCGSRLPLTLAEEVQKEYPGKKQIYLHPLSELDLGSFGYGAPTSRTGKAMVGYILKAIGYALNRQIDGIVTCPINKAAIALAGYPYPGHTELLAAETKTQEYAMMLTGETLKVVLVTIHHQLKQVPELLSKEKIVSCIRLTHRALNDHFGVANPRVAVAALNPHAGEEGLFGAEEHAIIAPAIREAQAEGIDAAGPFPADTLFYHAVRGGCDAVVCMYHDQGLIPLKLLHFEDAVNVTLGLPIIRTSVDHGTAYDIAGTGQANPKSLINAVKMAAHMVLHRRQ
jgi:4-hydroxythreonine-4-phosphate dehydrogenase